MRVLVPSIVDPEAHRGGAGTVTRGLTRLLQSSALATQVEYICPASARRRFHRARQVSSLARSLISPLPSKALLTYSRRFLMEVQAILRDRPVDLVILNGSDLLWILPELPLEMPRILLAHNIEHQLFRSQIDTRYSRSGFRREALMRDWRCLQEYEMNGMRAAENVIFLSKQDAAFAEDADLQLRSLVVPPLFDYRPSSRRHTSGANGIVEIGFVGNFNWWPNREGLRWFLTEVLPRTTSDTRLHLFGEETNRVNPLHPRVITHGFMPSTDDIWSMCDFMICPIHAGGGVNVKLAETIYNGVPALTTSFGTRGLPLSDDPGIVVLNTAEEWIAFLNSQSARALGSRRVLESNAGEFAMQAHAERVRSYIHEVIRTH